MWVALTTILAVGCATTKPTPSHFVFFPGAPDPPRLQYLVSFGTEKDLGSEESGFSQFITGQKKSDKPLGKVYGLAMHDKKIYVCDSEYDSVLVLDVAKHTIDPLPLEGETALAEPVNITIGPDGTRYIADDRREQVLCLDASNQLKWVLGHKDEMKPRDVAVDQDRIYVADVKAHAVRVYDKSASNLLFSIPRDKDRQNPNALLLMPSNLALDAEGRLYASDTAAGRVEVYDRDGRYVQTLGGFGDAPEHGLLKRPKGVAVDRDGVVYVVDAVYELVQMFDSKGDYLMCFGYPGSSSTAGLHLPAKVIVDYDNVGLFAKYAAPDFKIDYLVLVTSQFGPRKVSVFGFGHKK
jgi:DNA-binding beta-propeller fold protein YncE